MDDRILRLTDQPSLKDQAAEWFHEKWDSSSGGVIRK